MASYPCSAKPHGTFPTTPGEQQRRRRIFLLTATGEQTPDADSERGCKSPWGCARLLRVPRGIFHSFRTIRVHASSWCEIFKQHVVMLSQVNLTTNGPTWPMNPSVFLTHLYIVSDFGGELTRRPKAPIHFSPTMTVRRTRHKRRGEHAFAWEPLNTPPS